MLAKQKSCEIGLPVLVDPIGFAKDKELMFCICDGKSFLSCSITFYCFRYPMLCRQDHEEEQVRNETIEDHRCH